MFRVGQGVQLPTGIRATSGLRYDARCSRSTESRGRSLLSSRALDASSVAIALESQNAPSANTKCANASFREMPKNYWTRSGRDMPFDLDRERRLDPTPRFRSSVTGLGVLAGQPV